MNELFLWIVLLVTSILGLLFCLWVVRRNLPVPINKLMWINWMLWAGISICISFGIFMLVIMVIYFEILEHGEFLQLEVFSGAVKFIALSAGYWISSFYAIALQLKSRRENLENECRGEYG